MDNIRFLDGKPVLPKTVTGPGGVNFTVYEDVDKAIVKDRTVSCSVDISNMPKIPFMVMLKIRYYYYQIYRRYDTESFVFLHWDQAQSQYIPVVPGGYRADGAAVSYYPDYEQFCSDCHIALPAGEFGRCPFCGSERGMEKLVIFGTTHSHVDMAPFHSGTDNEHEMNHTGFHLTFGYHGSGLFGTELSFVARSSPSPTAVGVRQKLVDEDCIEMPFSEEEMSRLDLWLSRVAIDKSFVDGETYFVVVNSGKDPVFMGTQEECKNFEDSCYVEASVQKFRRAPVGNKSKGKVSSAEYAWMMMTDDDDLDGWGGYDPYTHPTIFDHAMERAGYSWEDTLDKKVSEPKSAEPKDLVFTLVDCDYEVCFKSGKSNRVEKTSLWSEDDQEQEIVEVELEFKDSLKKLRASTTEAATGLAAASVARSELIRYLTYGDPDKRLTAIVEDLGVLEAELTKKASKTFDGAVKATKDGLVWEVDQFASYWGSNLNTEFSESLNPNLTQDLIYPEMHAAAALVLLVEAYAVAPDPFTDLAPKVFKALQGISSQVTSEYVS